MQTYDNTVSKKMWRQAIHSDPRETCGISQISPSPENGDGEGIGRIRLQRVADASEASLLPFVQNAVLPGSVVHTDGWKGYANLGTKGYKHTVTNIRRSEELAHELMPRVHRVASLLKRWLLGTHQGAVQPQHLDYYIDEFTFRFNRRRSRARGLLFYRLLEQALAVNPVPYRHLVGGKNTPTHKL